MSADRIISADSHFDIPVERIVEYLPKKYREPFAEARKARIAKLVGSGAPTGALRNKAAGTTPVEQVPKQPARPYPAAGRAGGWDPHERLKDMDIDGVDAEVLYVNFGDVDAFYGLDDEGCSAGFRAFTSAVLDIAAPDPDRLVPVYPLLLHDIDLTVREVRRIADQGGRAVMVPAYPTDYDLAPYWDEVYDPLWSALEDLGMPVSQHVGLRLGAADVIGRWDPTPVKAIMQSTPPIFMSELLAGWVTTGIFDRHLDLRVVLVEAGIGWIPYFLHRLDTMQHRHNWAGRGLDLPKLPSEYWSSNMAATFEEDAIGMLLLDRIGEDNIMWATDYPHPDCTWPESQKVIANEFGHLPEPSRRKLVHANAARLYRL